MKQCDVRYEDGQCDRPAVVHVQTGCRHEHISEFDWCHIHATFENIRMTAMCRDCWEQEGIETPIAVRVLGDVEPVVAA